MPPLRKGRWVAAKPQAGGVVTCAAINFSALRKIVPEHFLLVPGVGAQGGSLEEVCKYGMTKDCGLIVNSSRAIIYADKTERFADRKSVV